MNTAPLPASDRRTATILVVDGNTGSQIFLSTILVDAGYHAINLGHARQAAALSARISIDLLLTDIILSSMAPWEMADRIAAHNPRLKVIFMASCNGEMAVSQGLCPAGSDILQKPIYKESLLNKVRTCLESEKYWARLSTAITN